MRRLFQNLRKFNTKAQSESLDITVPIGNLPCRWYGPTEARPLVAYQGMSANAMDTYKALAPLISKNIGFLEVNFPSEKLPQHTAFHFSDMIQINLQLMKHFNWDKISLLGYAYGGFAAFNFASFFPDKVDLLVTLDLMSTSASPDQIIQNLSRRIEKIANQSAAIDEKAFAVDECVEALHKISNQTIDRAFCSFIMERKLKPSAKSPGKFCFLDEETLKGYFNDWFYEEVVMEMTKRLQCSYLAIVYQNKQWPYNMQKMVYEKAYEYLKSNHQGFEHQVLNGSPHLHFDSPDKVSEIINNFVGKCGQDIFKNVEKAK